MQCIVGRNERAWAATALALFIIAPMAALAAARESRVLSHARTQVTAIAERATISLDTRDRRVTLHGLVSTPAERSEAERNALATPGVRSVRNLLQVVPASEWIVADLEDHRLEQRVQLAIEDDGPSGGAVVVRSIHNGFVLLGGWVATPMDRVQALEAVARVQGVRGVASTIEARTPAIDSRHRA